MNPQTQNEARRIVTVMEELLEDLAIIAVLPPSLSSMPPTDMQHLLDSFNDEDGGQEVQQQLTEHYDMERRLESASGDMTADDIEDLHFSTRSIVDTMRYAGYPLKYRASFPPSQNILNCREIFETLNSLLKDRLSNTVEEDVMKYAILNDTVSREKNASADVQALTREHQQEKDSRRIEVERRDATIGKLREELTLVGQSAKQDQKKLIDEMIRQEEEDGLKFKARLEKLKADVETEDAKYRRTRDACVDQEMQLRVARTKKESQLSTIIQHYDKEMRESTAKIKELQEEIDKDRDELDKVEAELSRLVADRESDEAEDKLADQCHRHTAEIAKRRADCATTIQSYYRAHAFRVAMANKGKKKGKKK